MKLHSNGATFNVLQSSIANPKSSIVLVFLHYFGGSSRSWCPLMDSLQSTFRCIAPDLRGFGDSSQAPDHYSVNDAADDLSALIASLPLENYALVGHSMGGKIALEMAARQPRGLQSLILLAPSPPTPEPMEEAERERLLKTRGDRTAAQETLGKITAHPLPAALFEQAVQDNERSSRAVWQSWLQGGSREDISSRMTRIQVPTLVVAGACDSAMTPALLQRDIVACIAQCTLYIVPDAAHLLPLEEPSQVADLIETWVIIKTCI